MHGPRRDKQDAFRKRTYEVQQCSRSAGEKVGASHTVTSLQYAPRHNGFVEPLLENIVIVGTVTFELIRSRTQTTSVQETRPTSSHHARHGRHSLDQLTRKSMPILQRYIMREAPVVGRYSIDSSRCSSCYGKRRTECSCLGSMLQFLHYATLHETSKTDNTHLYKCNLRNRAGSPSRGWGSEKSDHFHGDKNTIKAQAKD